MPRVGGTFRDGHDSGYREIERVIASAAIFSSDGKLLMGRKDPHGGGVYPDMWHIPGGGRENGESLDDAVIREVGQEVVGLDLAKYPRKPLPWVDRGSALKTLPTGERVRAIMIFHRFEVHLDELADELTKRVMPGSDLIELRWVAKEELRTLAAESDINKWFADAGYLS